MDWMIRKTDSVLAQSVSYFLPSAVGNFSANFALKIALNNVKLSRILIPYLPAN